MRELERINITVKQIFPEKQLLIGIEHESQREIYAKMKFEDLFPQDELILYGEYFRNHKMGSFFRVDYYREKMDHDLWLAKWLKLKKQYTHKEIEKMVLYETGMEEVWEEYSNMLIVHQVFVYLEEQGVDDKTLAMLEKRYRWHMDRLYKNPYLLLEETGVSYAMVQHIIKEFQCKSPVAHKGKYLLEHLLRKAYEQGHFYLQKANLLSSFRAKQFDLEEILALGGFVEYKENIYLSMYFTLEKNISANIKERLTTKTEHVQACSQIEEWEQEQGFLLAKSQKEAVAMSLEEQFSVVTGGPGVGKTTVCKCITDILGKTCSIKMVAPTGRAAKRAHESTGLETSTIHSLLEYNGSSFGRTNHHLIETDVLVIDESSMVDAPLLYALLQALPLETKIIFVGDVDQLPSVGAGQILHDLIRSGVIPFTRLTEIFRQAADSPIITCAYEVNEAKMPSLESKKGLTYVEKEEEEDIFEETITIAESLYRTKDIFDVQILIPMYEGKVGINQINEYLQETLNGEKPYVTVKKYRIYEGDKVLHTKNDKNKKIYNGDVGVVTKCTPTKISVRFQGETKETHFPREEFSNLQLAFAITVHRSQGSEYPFTIIPVVNSYGRMLQKNLLYTGITRAKKELWMLFQKDALEKSISHKSVVKRNTTLHEFLKQPLAS